MATRVPSSILVFNALKRMTIAKSLTTPPLWSASQLLNCSSSSLNFTAREVMDAQTNYKSTTARKHSTTCKWWRNSSHKQESNLNAIKVNRKMSLPKVVQQQHSNNLITNISWRSAWFTRATYASRRKMRLWSRGSTREHTGLSIISRT